MTRTEREADVRTIAAVSVSAMAALTLWGAVVPASVAYLSIAEVTSPGLGPLIAPALILAAAVFTGGLGWNRLVEHRSLRRRPDRDGPEGVEADARRRVLFIANTAGLFAAMISWRALTYASTTAYVGAPAGDFIQVLIPADIARGMVLGASAYAIVQILAIGLLTGGDLWPQSFEPEEFRSPHS